MTFKSHLPHQNKYVIRLPFLYTLFVEFCFRRHLFLLLFIIIFPHFKNEVLLYSTSLILYINYVHSLRRNCRSFLRSYARWRFLCYRNCCADSQYTFARFFLPCRHKMPQVRQLLAQLQ